ARGQGRLDARAAQRGDHLRGGDPRGERRAVHRDGAAEGTRSRVAPAPAWIVAAGGGGPPGRAGWPRARGRAAGRDRAPRSEAAEPVPRAAARRGAGLEDPRLRRVAAGGDDRNADDGPDRRHARVHVARAGRGRQRGDAPQRRVLVRRGDLPGAHRAASVLGIGHAPGALPGGVPEPDAPVGADAGAAFGRGHRAGGRDGEGSRRAVRVGARAVGRAEGGGERDARPGGQGACADGAGGATVGVGGEGGQRHRAAERGLVRCFAAWSSPRAAEAQVVFARFRVSPAAAAGVVHRATADDLVVAVAEVAVGARGPLGVVVGRAVDAEVNGLAGGVLPLVLGGQAGADGGAVSLGLRLVDAGDGIGRRAGARGGRALSGGDAALVVGGADGRRVDRVGG